MQDKNLESNGDCSIVFHSRREGGNLLVERIHGGLQIIPWDQDIIEASNKRACLLNFSFEEGPVTVESVL